METSLHARCCVDAYLRADLSEKFYGIFRPREESPPKKKNDKKKGKKKSKLKEKSRKRKREKSPETGDGLASNLEMHGNASNFNVYAKVRQAVLEHSMREASRVYQQANSAFHSDSDSEDEGEDKSREGYIKIPKIVGLGLSGVFELIRETETKYPELCIKALRALLDLLQGQQPEAMKAEPSDIIEKLYELLLDLATSSVPEENTEGQVLTALACSGLLSLIVALGDTGKMLNAVQSLLRSPPSLKSQEIQVPSIVTHLQRSIQAVLIGRAQLPEWFSQGVREKARCEKFCVDVTVEDDLSGESSAIASDGRYLYVLIKDTLYKIGSGYGGTIKGHLYRRRKSCGNKKVWLAYAGGKLFSKCENNSTVSLCVINQETLETEDTLLLEGNHTAGPSILFSDGDNIGQIAPAKDQDNFVVRTYSPTESPLPLQHEVPLKLTRKCIDIVGTGAIDSEVMRHSVATAYDEDAATIFSGKEFGLIRTVGGKVLYTGKASALGIKQGELVPGKWTELPITKSPKILQIAIGHEGQHALLVAEDGSVFFVGMSRRGEDGDSSLSKARRQPKAVKPKKMIRLESKHVVWAACNVGSSAVVTREGEVYIFGKDNTYCDHSTGLVTDLKDVVITQMALGKAHAVALTVKGRIYTFGINNKGQCGRDFTPVSGREASNNVTMVEEEEEVEADDTMCPPGKHRWKQYQCMVCTMCGECTGYGASCINSSRENRSLGEPCGCGAGDSGCSECGVCRLCAGEKLEVDELDDRGLLGVLGAKKEVIPLDVLLSGRQHRQDYLARRLEQKQMEKGELKRVQKLAKEKRNRAAEGGGNELDTDYTKSVTLAPAEVIVGNGHIAVTQVACGLHHTVVLLQNGDVYTFGSNSCGQLGLGDTNPRGMPTKVPLPLAATHVAAGNHHTVILLSSGQVYTCGDYQKGALGREGPDEMVVKSKKAPWCSTLGPIPGVGGRLGRRATWVGANGDQTLMRIDESLINAHTLARSNIFASQSCIGLIPKGEESATIMKCLMISKLDGNCKSFRDGEQEDLRDYSVCLDPVYDVLWGFSLKNGEVRCYNVMMADSRNLPHLERGYCHILSPELAVPAKAGCQTSRSHCALHILGCLDTLTVAQQLNITVAEELQERQTSTKVYTKEDYAIVNRFESHGGGWGYSGHSVEAVRFMCDTDILLGGFGLFGGRGEYFGRIKIFELGIEGGENETDGELMAETEEMAFECGPREKYAMLFEEPVPLQANCWYVALARISGPSSDCGSGGQSTVTTDDQVVFKFKSSKKSNNGTDVNAGQIPQLLYRLPSRDSPSIIRRNDHTEPAHVLSQDFALSVSPQCFEALLQLLEWAWNSFHSSISDIDGLKGVNREAAVADLKRLVYICCSCLRLMKIYVSEVYPDGVSKKKIPTENSEMVQCIGDMRELLKRILAEEVTPSAFRIFLTDPTASNEFADLREEMLQECHDAYCACFHAFYPTTTLKWWCLCELLSQIEPILGKKMPPPPTDVEGAPNVAGIGRLLAAVMEALCHPTVWLTNIMPINLEPETVEVLRRHSFCMDDNTNSAARLGEFHRYPLLASHMSYRMEIDSIGSSHISFREVLDRLLMIVALPVRQALNDDPPIFPDALVSNTCALLTTIISELGSSATGLEMDVSTTSRPLLVTPNRFYRTSQSAYWNTGNGSPDAVCFSVDRPGIVVAGICMYGGGGTYEYEVELLDEQQSDVQGELAHTQRFNSLEIVKGVFSFEDCVNDIMEIKFDHPIPIKEGIRYAVKLRNHGPRTLNGDGGLVRVKCPDGTTFTFSACPLSSNGTNQIRGQVPQILYYSSLQEGESQHQSIRNLAELQARKNALDIASAIVRMATDLLNRAQSLDIEDVGEILGQSSLFASLLPLALAYVGPVAAQDPRGAVQVLYLIQEILPAVVGLTKQMVPSNLHCSFGSDATSTTATTTTTIADSCTTSPHYAMVESDHPYKQATVSHYKVEFPSSVQWMALEFDPQCATAQVEDSLQLYVPSHHPSAPAKAKPAPEEDVKLTHWPVLKRFHGNTFPKEALILPGNEVIFSLETASDYLRDEKQSFYGFKCTVIGYEWSVRPEETVIQLEKELAYLGGLCAASLMKKDISLPQVTMEELDDEIDLIEEHAQLVYQSHASLLGKGFALSQPPSIIQALEGSLPFCWQSNERAFLKDYVLCTPGTSGGRLARWLQPDSYLDPKLCEIVCNSDDLKCSWPTVITILTRDQYGQLVNVPDLKVEVKAIPVDQKDNMGDDYKRIRRMSRPDEGDLSFGGLPMPLLDTPYEPTMKERKDVYHSISMMKAYDNYSFEELRFAAPAVPRPSENMLVRTNNDGSCSANWTPGCVGCYNIHVNVDGYQAGEVYKVEVKEPPQGVPPPTQVMKKTHQPSRLRRFVQSCSAGLRIRVHPTLQSEQIGVIKPEGIISFIDEVHNDDGVWLRLGPESSKEWCCDGYTEAWCLQYNQHLGKTLLVPVEEPKSIMGEMSKESGPRKSQARRAQKKQCKGRGIYQLVKCGAYGHNIRTRPNLKATPVGMLTKNAKITALEDVVNADGTWVRLDQETLAQFCQSPSGDGWSLATGYDGIEYLQHESEFGLGDKDPFSFNSLPPASQRGFNFSASSSQYGATFPGFKSKAEGFTRAKSLPYTGFSFGLPTEGTASVPSFGQNYSEASAGQFGAAFGSNGDASEEKDANQSQHQEDSPFPPSIVSPRPPPPGESAVKSGGGEMGPTHSRPDLPPELQGASVKELVRALENLSSDCNPASRSALVRQWDKTFGQCFQHIGKLGFPYRLCAVNPKKIASIIGESRANANGPTPNPSPPGSPKTRSPKRSSGSASPLPSTETGSPELGRRGSFSREETFKTPPASPLPVRSSRGRLKKEPSFERSASTPPATPPPMRKEYLRGVSEGGVSPSTPVLIGAGSQRYGSPGRGVSPLGRGATSSPQFGGGAAGSPREGSPSSQMAGAFNIGSSSPKEDAARLSPKAMRKDRGRQLRSKRDRASSPASRDMPPVMRGRSSSASIILDRPRQPVKEALSPSVAECLRAVFAAFMWHEGIVHDAMACASFLKFHPDLTKEMSKFVKSKKQEKTRVRHATDSSKDRRERKKDNINESRVRFNLEPQTSDVTDYRGCPPSPMLHRPLIERQQSDGGSTERSPDWKDFDPFRGATAAGGDEKEPELPPTLQHLVYFWEELTSSIIKIIKQDLMLPSIVVMPKAKKSEKKEKEKEKEKVRKKRPKEGQRGGGRQQLEAAVGMMMLAAGGAAGGAGVAGMDKEAKEIVCELCGTTVPHPVTYHMRESHPGCGRHACGKGYNSGGNFCGGWAGNCGEGGIGGSTWYLMCCHCREKYMKEKRQSQKEKEKAKRKLKKSCLSKQHTQLAQVDTHMVLKNNAMFLLDLASASGFVLPKHSHKKAPFLRSDIILPSVSENFGTDLEPFPSVPFQYLIQQNASHADSAFADDFFIDDEERVFVRSGSLSITQTHRRPYRPRLPTEPRHSPLARSGSLGQEIRPFSHISLVSPQEKGERPLHDHKPIIKSAGTSPEGEQDGGKKMFHRSISEYVSDDENGQSERVGNRGLYARRRNNSGGVSDGGMSLLKHPSASMTKLIGSVDRSAGSVGEHRALQRPVLEFIVQRHDLDGLQLAMKQALRKAACRVFAMQAFNWLLRSVVQQTCLHDLLWFFVISLMPSPEGEEEEEEPPKEHPKKDQQEVDVPLCEHPLADIGIAGKAVTPLPETFHGVLQTISDVIMHLPSGSALQRMAVSCYCLRFQQSDHQFLHESHVFSNISRILSKSEEEQEESSIDASQIAFRVTTLKDLTSTAELKASSRQAMIASLTDNSTETFWESGDEDRNKVKIINITCSNTNPQVIYVHIDNTRDLAAKVTNISFSAGASADALSKIYQVEVDLRQAGWVACPLPAPRSHSLQLELKGPDQSLRVRQVKVLGLQAGEESYLPVKKAAWDLQQDNCEAETLRVFRILTAQVFGHLIFAEKMEEKVEEKKENPPIDRDHDLKEHMVGILFSRSKLSYLQKQVCSHIVQGIRKETMRIREEWENSLALSSSVHDDTPEDGRGVDAYCFELLSMVLALSGSTVGRNYLAQQHHLLQDLFSLLHTATPRIQRQVTSVLRRVLPDVRPQVLATILSVPALPPVDYSIAAAETQEEGDASFDPDRSCILDVFLGFISKALTLQMKVKSGGPSKGVVSVTLAEALDSTSIKPKGSRWWLRGTMSSSLASTIIALIQDMAAGTLSDTWASVTKAAIAEAILNLTKLDVRHRSPDICIKTPTLWLAVAALCVLDKDHVERLSSGEWVSSPDGQHGQPRPTCDNHDDGVTPAIVLCNVCNNLCADCDRFLHLHRKTRSHQRQVFKEEEEAIKVDLHEGCGRTKLFWVMALTDSKTLKAMVEFREGKVAGAGMGPGTCRFCGTQSSSGLLAMGNVCSDPDCQAYAENACAKMLSCGHLCGGIRDEDPCLPCLHRCRPSDQETLKQDADDMCMICFTEALSAAPAIQFSCGHVFHLHCSKVILEKQWNGPRITFGFSLCPICKSNIEHRVLRSLLDPVRRLYEDVRRKALMRLEYEGLHKAEAITTPGARFFQDPAGFAMDRYAYYVCSKCNKAYYGGEARCEEQAGGGEDYDPTELVCGACSDVSRAQMCPKHGTDFLEYKCRYCCSVAVFFCFGTTHFCNACHDDFQRVTNIPKTDLPSCPAGPRGKQLDCEECPLHVQHPPTGEEFALGCGVCRNAHTF